MRNSVLGLAERMKSDLIRIRREIHRHPELGFEEHRTAELVASELRRLAVDVKEGVGRTGVVGLLRGDEQGRVIAIRSDMDALPIEERTGLPFKSETPGVMHACGHDAHMACVLGAATILRELRDELRGVVKFIFQPSEESPPGGATLMIEEGVLEDPKVDAILSLHSEPTIGSGSIGVRSGVMFAAADNFRIAILGEGGHAARPHDSVDAIVVASQVVLALQTVASRRVDPLTPVVLTIGKMGGGYRSNVIADRVELEGTVRTLSQSWRDKIPEIMEETISGVVKGLGGGYQFDYELGYPVLSNDESMTDLVRRVGKQVLGAERVAEIERPGMGGEDFAFYLERVPGAMFRLGTGNEEKHMTYPWHHPKFDIDEDSLPIGAAILAQCALEYLKENRSGY